MEKHMPTQMPDTQGAETQEFDRAFDQAVKESPATAPSAMEPAGDPMTSPAPESEMEAAPDYQALYEKELQRRKSLEGRVRKERRQKDEERQHQELADPFQGPAPADAAPEFALPAHEAEEPALEPLIEALTAERHVAAIAARHPDWRDIADSPALDAWIGVHPPILADRLREVADTGTAEEVSELLDRFKADLARERSQDLAARQETRRQALAQTALAVRGRSGGPPMGRPDPSDFASAWSEAVDTDHN
jgi:hypothetical protein